MFTSNVFEYAKRQFSLNVVIFIVPKKYPKGYASDSETTFPQLETTETHFFRKMSHSAENPKKTSMSANYQKIDGVTFWRH